MKSFQGIALFVLMTAQVTFAAMTSTEIVDNIKGMRRLADKFSLSSTQKTDFITGAKALVPEKGQMATEQASDFQQILEDARWGGVFGSTQEVELEQLIEDFKSATAPAASATTVSSATGQTEDPALDTDLFNLKLDAFATKLSVLGQLWYSDNARALIEKASLLADLQSLIDRRADAFPEELIRFEGLLNAGKWNAAFKNDTDAQTAFTNNQALLSAISFDLRLIHVEHIYTGGLISPASKERLMKHFNALVSDGLSATEGERKRLEDLLTFAKYNQFSDSQSSTVIDGLLKTLAAQAGAVPEGTSEEVPDVGAVITLQSKANNKYVRVVKPENQTTYALMADGDDALGEEVQFKIVKSQGKIGLRSFAAGSPEGLLIQTAQMGKPYAGKARLSTNKFPSEDKTVEFYMYGTLADASFLNEGSGGFLSVLDDKQVVTIDPYTFQQIGLNSAGDLMLGADEKFTVTVLSALHVGLGKTRQQDMATAVGAFITLFGQLASDDQRKLYVSELEYFVNRVRATDESWAEFYSNNSVVDSFTRLLAYLVVSPDMSVFSGKISGLQDALQKGPTMGELPISGIAKEEDMPADGTTVSFFSHWAEKDGSNPLKKYLKVVQDEATGRFYVTGAADSVLDVDTQFIVVREGSRMGFRSAKANSLMMRTPAAGEKGAGKAGFANGSMAGPSERFLMVGTKDKASFMNEATKGFLSVRRDDKILMSLDPDTFEPAGGMKNGILIPYSWEQFKVVPVTPFLTRLGQVRGKSYVVALEEYKSIMDTAATTDERVALIKEVRRLILGMRESRQAWQQVSTNDLVMARLSGLLVSLFGRSEYQAYNGYIKEMLDLISLEDQREIALSPRNGSYAWLVDDSFSVNRETGMSFGAQYFATESGYIGISSEARKAAGDVPLYEIILGSESNRESIINHKGEKVASFTFSFNGRSYEKIWVTCKDGMVRAGTGDVGMNKLVEWQDPAMEKFDLVGVSSGASPVWIQELDVTGFGKASGTAIDGQEKELALEIKELESTLAGLQSSDQSYLDALTRLVARRLEATMNDMEQLKSLIANTQYNANFYDVSSAQSVLKSLLQELQRTISIDERITFGWTIKTLPRDLENYQASFFERNISELLDVWGDLTAVQQQGMRDILNFALYNQYKNNQDPIKQLIVRIDDVSAQQLGIVDRIANLQGKVSLINSAEMLQSFLGELSMLVTAVQEQEPRVDTDLIAATDFLTRTKGDWRFSEVGDQMDQLIADLTRPPGFEKRIMVLTTDLGKVSDQSGRDLVMTGTQKLVSDMEAAVADGQLREGDRSAATVFIEKIKQNWMFGALKDQLNALLDRVKSSTGASVGAMITKLQKDLEGVSTAESREAFLTGTRNMIDNLELARAGGTLKEAEKAGAKAFMETLKADWRFGNITEEIDTLIGRIDSATAFAGRVTLLTTELSGVNSQEARDSFMANLNKLVGDAKTAQTAGNLQEAERVSITGLISATKENWMFGSLQNELTTLEQKLTASVGFSEKITALKASLAEVDTQEERDVLMVSMKTMISDMHVAQAAGVLKSEDAVLLEATINDAKENWYFSGVGPDLDGLIASLKAGPSLTVRLEDLSGSLETTKEPEQVEAFVTKLETLVGDWQAGRALDIEDAKNVQPIIQLIDKVQANWLFGGFAAKLSEMKSTITGEIPFAEKVETILTKMDEVVAKISPMTVEKARFVASITGLVNQFDQLSAEQQSKIKPMVEKMSAVSSLTKEERKLLEDLLKALSEKIEAKTTSQTAGTVNTPVRSTQIARATPGTPGTPATPSPNAGRVGRDGVVRVIRSTGRKPTVSRQEFEQQRGRSRGARR